MNKPILMLAALTLGTAAIAQNTPMTPDQSTAGGTPPSTTMAPSSDMSAPAASPTDAGTPAPAPTDAGMPAGGMSPDAAAAPMASPAPAPADTSNYPRCSKTIKDKCMNAGSAKSRRHR